MLRPGGRFHHCDMLRPGSRAIETLYYAYLRPCLTFTAFAFGSGEAAQRCKDYFIEALQLFYSDDELTALLAEVGFRGVTGRTVLAGTVGFHRAVKP